jgi:glucuronoarabinoxylan endo-1,4-beta-xylanase
MKSTNHSFIYILSILVLSITSVSVRAQSDNYKIVSVSTEHSYQTMEGFGGALAYYENWLPAHPNKTEIYEALFSELSLDILRLRNAYDYSDDMIPRAKEFVTSAELYRGSPIDVLVSSWGPPKYLKSNNNRRNGGTLKYEKTQSGVEFAYADFAHWWTESLDEYNSNGIYPTYISIQNEPDFKADWESCLLNPSEVVTSSDTIAGYNKALDEIYDSIQGRAHIPKLLGPENIGIGYNSVENYINQLDLSKLHGIGHHLYHGIDEDSPYASPNFKKVGNLHPEVPHFQTEFSRGDWWSLLGQIYMSLNEEHVVAYLYWSLFWPDQGLIDTDNPWNRSSWSNSKGYKKTKEFYAFKQYSAFIHPGWTMVQTDIPGDEVKSLTFMSPNKDSASVVIINTSEESNLQTAITIPGYKIDKALTYITSVNKNCELVSELANTVLEVPMKSVATIALSISETTDVLIDNIILAPSAPSIDMWMDSINISAVITPEMATNKTLFWQLTSGAELATLSQNGILKALGIGDGIVQVKASAIDGSGIEAELDVTISNQVLVESISLTASGGKINTPGGSIQFTATVLPEEAFNKEIFWEILSGSEIATISQSGLLEALGVSDGSVTIQVSSTEIAEIAEEITIPVSNQTSSIRPWSANDVKAWYTDNCVFYEIPTFPSEFEFSIYSLDGKLIFSEKRPGDASSGTIPLRETEQGLYILRISNNTNIATVFLSVY